MFRKSNNANSVDFAKTEKRRRFWQKARRRTLWGLAIFIAAHSIVNIYASLQLNRELAAIRQKGEPLQFAESAPPAIPDAQNAALIYAKAYKAVRLTGEEKTALNTPSRKRDANALKLIESALNKNQQAIALVHQAAAMPECRFPMNWKGDPTIQNFPYYAELRQLARLLADHARQEASKQNTDAALRDVLSIFSMSRHLSSEPFLIGFLVGQTVNGIGNQALASILETSPVSASQASNFQALLPESDAKSELRHSLIRERTMSNYVFFRLERTPTKSFSEMDMQEKGMLVLAYPFYLLYVPFLKLDHIQTLRFWDRLINSSEFQQIPRPQNVSESFKKQVEDAPPYALFTKILLPTFAKSNDNVARAETRQRQRDIALALAVYRSEHNRYPTNLEGLKTVTGKSLPIDLFSGKPFNYRIEGKGYVLYSVGINRTDDGGKGRLGLKPSRDEDDDILWGGSRR